jgi:hypothetical protein
MMDFSSHMTACCMLNKIDLRKGYHQIPVDPADIPKKAIITAFGGCLSTSGCCLAPGMRETHSNAWWIESCPAWISASVTWVMLLLPALLLSNTSPHLYDFSSAFRMTA